MATGAWPGVHGSTNNTYFTNSPSQPFGNRTVILTLTGAQLEQAFLNGFSPACNPAIATGRFPQISGLTARTRATARPRS